MPNPKFQILSKPMTLPPVSRCSCLSVSFGYVALFDVLAALEFLYYVHDYCCCCDYCGFPPFTSGIVGVQWKPGQY